jgi:hypothetical protein
MDYAPMEAAPASVEYFGGVHADGVGRKPSDRLGAEYLFVAGGVSAFEKSRNCTCLGHLIGDHRM